jgi:flagellar protein FliS
VRNVGERYGADQYLQVAVKTASRAQILVMLYEAAIRHVQKAAAAIERHDAAGKGLAIGKAHDIVSQLLVTLDHAGGGAIAANLERLYHFMTRELGQANLENSSARLRGVQKLLQTLLDGWKGAVAQVACDSIAPRPAPR